VIAGAPVAVIAIVAVVVKRRAAKNIKAAEMTTVEAMAMEATTV